MKFATAAAIAFACAISGCASVIGGDSQTLSVSSIPVAGASCALTNKRGTWSVVTPADVVVKKSQSTLKAVCTKAGWKDSTAYLSPTVSAQAIIGAVLIFGVVESAVDGATGAGNDYPAQFTIHMKPTDAAAPASPSKTADAAAARARPAAPNVPE